MPVSTEHRSIVILMVDFGIGLMGDLAGMWSRNCDIDGHVADCQLRGRGRCRKLGSVVPFLRVLPRARVFVDSPFVVGFISFPASGLGLSDNHINLFVYESGWGLFSEYGEWVLRVSIGGNARQEEYRDAPAGRLVFWVKTTIGRIRSMTMT